MNNELQVFENAEFGKVRGLEINGESWLVGKDVVECLGYNCEQLSYTKYIKKYCDKEDYSILKKSDLDLFGMTDAGRKGEYLINESGMYALVFGSDLPSAKNFKHWVTSEVLPTIRKHGAYMTEDVLEQAISNPDFMIGLLQNLKEEQEKRKLAESKLEEAKPMIAFAETVANSSDNIDMNEMAKLLSKENIYIDGKTIGRNKLFAYLRDNKILMNNNLPYQKYIDNKWFIVIETVKHTPYGDKTFTKTLVTGKGQIKIVEMIREANNI